MPTSGDFRLRLGNSAGSVLICTARTGTTLTVTVEQDDGNANVGDTVTLVDTAGASGKFAQDQNDGTYLLHVPVASGQRRLGPVVPLTPLDQSTWTWVNQGSATIQQSNGLVRFEIPSAASENGRVRVVTAPATPYTITAVIQPSALLAGGAACFIGLVWRESGTSKLAIFGLSSGFTTDGASIRIRKLTNETTFSSEPVLTAPWLLSGLLFLRIADNGTNTTYSYSFDGINYITALDEVRTTFFTVAPNQVGIGGWNNLSGVTQGATFHSWLQT